MSTLTLSKNKQANDDVSKGVAVYLGGSGGARWWLHVGQNEPLRRHKSKYFKNNDTWQAC